VDQLERSKGLDGGRVKAVRGELATAEKASGTARSSALEKLAGELETEAAKSSDGGKVRTLESAVKQLAGTTT